MMNISIGVSARGQLPKGPSECDCPHSKQPFVSECVSRKTLGSEQTTTCSAALSRCTQLWGSETPPPPPMSCKRALSLVL